tara:strand:- start:342 stop:521 length:180 start_codon:yes stop_codon:yes gene_type:complete
MVKKNYIKYLKKKKKSIRNYTLSILTNGKTYNYSNLVYTASLSALESGLERDYFSIPSE